MLKTALKIEKKSFFEVDPKKMGKSYGKKRESKVPLRQKFQGFCDIFNGT